MSDVMLAGETSQPGHKLHLVVAGASQWGQDACARVLHRVVAFGGRVTLIVARRFEKLFRTQQPSGSEWRGFASLAECLDTLQRDGKPIKYVFDDHLHHLAADLLQQELEYLRLGYVVTGAEEHYSYARVLATCCDRVLVEKPVSNLVEDVRPGGRLEQLRNMFPSKPGGFEGIYSCEHFSFRKGFTDAKGQLDEFVERHRRHGGLRYEFRFLETDTRERLAMRPSAMQDGSILDVAVTHGLGALAYILRRRPIDLHQAIRWTKVLPFQAREGTDPESPLVVPVLAETAARLEGVCKSEWHPRIDLVLESGKGAVRRERWIRVSCPRCCEEVKGSDQNPDKVFLGISLGAAGFSVSDWTEGERFVTLPNPGRGQRPRLGVLVRDLGFQSDLRAGDLAEAENAQAAMLERFVAPEGDKRFLELHTACQIVRLGIEAQALAFCRQRMAYELGELDPAILRGAGEAEEPSTADESVHTKLKEIWKGPPSEVPLAEALGLEEEEPSPECFRVATVLGPEGYGNTDVAELLKKQLEELEETSKVETHLLSVPRDESWCHGRGSGKSTVGRLLRELARALEIASVAAEDPVAELLRRISDLKTELNETPRVLLFNGVDRLDDKTWSDLIQLLDQLPKSHRLVLVTNRGDRAGGWVVRTEELAQQLNRDPESQQRLEAVEHRAAFKSSLGDSLDEEGWDRIEALTKRVAVDNVIVERQLIAWLQHVFVPHLGPKYRLDPSALQEQIEQAVASIGLPRTLTPYPERFLSRLSRACLAAVDPASRRKILALARLPEGAPTETLEAVFPGLLEKILAQGPIAALFSRTPDWRPLGDPPRFTLFPRVRSTVSELAERRSGDGMEESLLNLEIEVADRRVLLVHPEGEEYWEDKLDRLLAIGERGEQGLGKLDLDGTLLEDLCRRIVETLEVGQRGRTKSLPAQLLTLLVRRPTNLGMSTRALLLSLNAWMTMNKCTSDFEIVGVMNNLAGAWEVARNSEPFDKALDELLGQREESVATELRQQLQIQNARRLVAAEIFRDFTWHWLLDLTKTSTYVFGRKILLQQAAGELAAFHAAQLSEDGTNALLLKARISSALAFFHARETPVNEGLDLPTIPDPKAKKAKNKEVQRLRTAVELSRLACEWNKELADEHRSNGELDRLGREAARGAVINHINTALLLRLVAKRTGKSSGAAKKQLADAAQYSQAVEGIGLDERPWRVPYFALVKARFLADSSRNQDRATQLAGMAAKGFRQRGQDYFARLAQDFEEHLAGVATEAKKNVSRLPGRGLGKALGRGRH